MNTQITHEKDIILSTGIRLRNAREQLGLSQKEVAERLCLKISTIRDIEEDKVSDDLDTTFLRGYIRSYAKLVRIPENELLPEIKEKTLNKLDTFSLKQNLLLNKFKKKRYNSLFISLIWLVLFVAISFFSIWWQNYRAQQEKILSKIDQSFVKNR